jgi:hypothetical protein
MASRIFDGAQLPWQMPMGGGAHSSTSQLNLSRL